jgi:hypothetical protein
MRIVSGISDRRFIRVAAGDYSAAPDSPFRSFIGLVLVLVFVSWLICIFRVASLPGRIIARKVGF